MAIMSSDLMRAMRNARLSVSPMIRNAHTFRGMAIISRGQIAKISARQKLAI